MTLADFELRVGSEAVVVFTGSRFLGDAEGAKIVRLGAGLARRFPRMRFRVGSARGANEAFGAGVCLVDGERLEVVFGVPRFRRDHMPEDGDSMAVDAVARGGALLGGMEVPFSPKYIRIAMEYTGRREISAHPRTRLLPREGIQVLGAPRVPAASVVLAWVTPGHTEDVSTHNLRMASVSGRVSFFAQDQWEGWFH